MNTLIKEGEIFSAPDFLHFKNVKKWRRHVIQNRVLQKTPKQTEALLWVGTIDLEKSFDKTKHCGPLIYHDRELVIQDKDFNGNPYIYDFRGAYGGHWNPGPAFKYFNVFLLEEISIDGLRQVFMLPTGEREPEQWVYGFPSVEDWVNTSVSVLLMGRLGRVSMTIPRKNSILIFSEENFFKGF